MILLSINMNRSLMQWKIFSIFCEYFSDAAILLIFLCFHGVPMTDLPNNSGQNEQAWSFKYSHDEQERREPKLIFFGTLLLSLHTNISLIIHPVLNASQSN